MNKLFIIVFLGLAATQVLSVVNTTVSEKWSVVPSVAINRNESTLKSTETLASAITINDNSTNNTNVTTITLAVPRTDNGKLIYVERTLVSSANTAIQRSGDDSTKKTLDNGRVVPTTILSQNGDLSFAAPSEDSTPSVFGVAANGTEWQSLNFDKPVGSKKVSVHAYWSPYTPRAAYKATTDNETHLYVANVTRHVAIYNLTNNVSSKVDESTVYVTDNVTFNGTAIPDTQINQTINRTYQGVSTDTIVTNVYDVACTNDLTINETGAVVCYISLDNVITTVTVNQTFATNTTYFKDNSFTTNSSSPDNTNITNTTTYIVSSVFYVRASLDSQNVTYTKNLTGAINAYKQLARGFLLATKSDNTTTLVYHVVEQVNETSPMEVTAINAINGDSDSAKTIKNNKDIKQMGAVSVESYFGGIVVFYAQLKGYDVSTLYTTLKSDLTAIDTQTLLVNNTYFRSFKSSSSEIFGIFGNATDAGNEEVDAVFVGKIFDVSDFASSIQTVFGFAAIVLAAIFAL